MNPNEQVNNTNNQQVIGTQQAPSPSQSTIKPNAPQKPFKVKKKNNKIIIIAVAAIIVIGAFFILNNTKTGQKILGGDNSKETEIIKVETSQKWGDKFAEALQISFLKDDEIEINGEIIEKYKPTEFGITFIDFEFDGTPEMAVKYTDSTGSEAIRIFQLNNNEVSESKDFKSADFRIIYSIREKTLKWYIYITSATSKKYGTYTSMDKILKRTAYDSDIKTTSDVEITTFNVNYITSDLRPSFYGIEVSSLAEDFKAAVLRYETTNKEAEDAKKQIEDNYGSVSIEEKEDQNDFLIIGKYTLNYGTYVTTIEVTEEGESKGTREETIVINRNGTVKIGDSLISFKVYSNLFVLNDNRSFTIEDNNKFRFGQGEGRIYEYRQ